MLPVLDRRAAVELTGRGLEAGSDKAWLETVKAKETVKKVYLLFCSAVAKYGQAVYHMRENDVLQTIRVGASVVVCSMPTGSKEDLCMCE